MLLVALSAVADDSAYEAVRDNIFWPVLYNRPYVSLYCGAAMPPGPGALVEPRDVVKGSIARSMLYMITRYGLPTNWMTLSTR